MEGAVGYYDDGGVGEAGGNDRLRSGTTGYYGQVLFHQLIQIRSENQDGLLVEKLVIPREDIVGFCNAAVPRSCNQNASKVHFDKLDCLQQYCYGVVGHRDAIQQFLRKMVGLDHAALDGFASRTAGIYGVSLLPPGTATDRFQDARTNWKSYASLVLVVLWPVETAFSSYSPNSTTSTCVRYITQLARHVFFCFDREGTLAFPSEQTTRAAPSRFNQYHFVQQVTQEESFSLHPGFDMDARASAQNSHAGAHPVARSIITGTGSLVAVLEQATVASTWAWNEGHTFPYDLTDEAGRPCYALRDGLQHYRVELHPDMPAGERVLFLRAMASANDRSMMDARLHELEEEQQRLAKAGEDQIAKARSHLDSAQRGFQQGVLAAFHSMLASRTQHPGALPPQTLQAGSGPASQFLSSLGHEEAALVMAHLRDRVQEVEGIIQATVARCCALGVLSKEAKAGGEEAWLRSQLGKSDAYLNSKLAHMGADAAMEVRSRSDLGYPFKELTGSGQSGTAPASSAWGWVGGFKKLWGGGSTCAWTPEDTRAKLSEWAHGQVSQALGAHEASLKREAVTGSLSVSRRLEGKKAELKLRAEESRAQAERACLAQLEQLILSPATAQGAPGGGAGDRQVMRVRRCVMSQRSILQKAASALYVMGGGMVDTVQVTADIQEPREPMLELTVSLVSAPRAEDAVQASHVMPQVMARYGRAAIPSSTLLVACIMNKGRWLLTVANMPNGRTAVTIHKLTGDGHHFTKNYGKPCVLADFDEATRLLAFYTSTAGGGKGGENTAFVYRFNEAFTNIDLACPPLELPSLSGSPELRDLKLLKTQRKLVMLDTGGRVRVYNVQQQSMERETYQAAASTNTSGGVSYVPTTLLITASGNFVMVVSTNTPNSTDASSKRPGRGSSAVTADSLVITPLAVPGLRALPQVEAKHPGGACSLATFSLGLGEQGTVNQYLGVLSAGTGALAAHLIRAQGREQAERIEAVGDASSGNARGAASRASEQCMLEYVFQAYDKFAVEGAATAQDDARRDVAMHMAVVLDLDRETMVVPTGLAGCVEKYVDGIERRLRTGYKPGVDTLGLSRNLVVLSAAAVDATWLAGLSGAAPVLSNQLLNAARRAWLSSAKSLQMGAWVRRLICLLPLQVARAEDNSFVLMADGMQLKAHARSTEEAVGMVSFGLLDAVLDAWHGDVVVVSSMGKQSTGKSYTLNHLFGTSFQISGARCTDGCWMGLCQVGEVMYVILDFEGLGSFERSEQEDMLLAVFNAAVSNYTLFKTEFRLDRDLEAMFSRFQSGTGLLKGDARLFQGCFCIVVKDVAERDVAAINGEFRSKIALITRPRDPGQRDDAATNFISGMFGGEFAIFPFPPLGRRDFYTAFGDLVGAIAQRPRHFTSGGGGFSSFMKQIMAKMVIKDWTTLEGQNVLHRVQYLSRHLDTAIACGRLEAQMLGLEEEALSCLDSGQEVASPDLNLDVVQAEEDDEVDIRALQIADVSVALRGKGADQESLIQRLLELFCKGLGPGADQTRWQSAFVAFVSEVVDRRCARVQQWVDVNLSPMKKEGGRLDDCAVRFMDEVASKLQQLRNEWQLCGSSCSHCFMSCLLPKSHPAAEHSCMGTHECSKACFFCSEADTDDDLPGSPSVHACAEKMGHGGPHCCRDKPHTCQESCRMAGSLNCNSTCSKKAGHERLPGGGSHMCNSPMHLCGKSCSAGKCKGKCQINAEKTHRVHKCAEVMCPQSCAVKGCTYTCSSRDHFHHTALSQAFRDEQGVVEASVDAEAMPGSTGDGGKKLHFCGREHACPRQCEADGICRITVQQVSEAKEETFDGKRSKFTYKSFSEANGHREKCAVRIPPYQLNHEGPHVHSLDPRVVHTCESTCPDCDYYCELPIKHVEKHKGAHGNIRNSIWVTTRKDGVIDFGDRKYVAGESTKAEICDMFCRTAGRGHTHILPCDAGTADNCTHAHKDGRAHDKRVFFPPRKNADDCLTHECYWDTIGWNDNCTSAEREEFGKCPSQCPHPQHDEDGQQPSYCEFELWHEEIDGDGAEKRAQEAETPEKTCFGAHVFPCAHSDWRDVFRKWDEEKKRRDEEKKEGGDQESDGSCDDEEDF